MEVKEVSKDEETFVICVRCMRLNLQVALLKELPVFTVFEACFDENAVQVCWEVLTANYLANKVDISLEVGPCAHLVSNLCYLIDLFPLDVLQSLIFDQVFVVATSPEIVFIIFKLGDCLLTLPLTR